MRTFDCPDGCYIIAHIRLNIAGLTKGSDGNLYGTTQTGGIYGAGTVYRLVFGAVPTSQSIGVTQGAPGSAIYANSFIVSATGGGSGNPVVIAASGACLGSGNNSASITMTAGTGTCTVTFNQAGNSNYSAAPQVTQLTTAQLATPTISISNIPSGAVNGGSFTPAFTYAGDGVTSVTSSTLSICTVSASVVNFIGGGTCTLTASATATANVTAATGSSQSFTIGAVPTTVSINNVPSSAVFGGSFKPTYTYNGDGRTSTQTRTTTVCTAVGGTVSFVGVGTCTLRASAKATASYLAAVGPLQSFAVGKATTTISIASLPKGATPGGSFTPTFSYIGDGATSVTSSTPAVCAVSGSVVNFITVGTCSLTAHATAGTHYNAVDGSIQSFRVK